MRTNIEIDDRLIREAMRCSGARTKEAVVEAGLRLLVQTHAQGSIRRLRGKVRWEGDLRQLRRSRVEAQKSDVYRRWYGVDRLPAQT
jgi:Arc/MetJ family transcription regulator